MKAELQITFQDYLNARRLSLRPRKSLRVVLYLLLAALLLFFAYGVYSTFAAAGSDKSWLWPLGVAAYFAFLYYLVIPWSARRIYKQQKSLHEAITVELTEEEILLTSTSGSSRVKYADLHKWKMNDKAVLLYHSDAIYHMLPTRIFSSAEDKVAFIDVLQKRLGKQRT